MQTSILSVVPWQEAAKLAPMSSASSSSAPSAPLGHARHRADSRHARSARSSRPCWATRACLTPPPSTEISFRFSRAFIPPSASRTFRCSLSAPPRFFVCLFLSLISVDSRHPGHALPHPIRGQAVGLMSCIGAGRRTRWPFRMWFYPLPVFRHRRLDRNFYFHGRRPMLASLAAMLAGAVIYFGRARLIKQWPFEEAA